MANAGGRRDSVTDRQGQRQDSRQGRLDDRQGYRDHARNEWQNWHDDHYGYHGHWFHGCWGGAYVNPGARLESWWDSYPVMTAFGMTSWAVNRAGYAFGWYDYSNPYVEGTGGGSSAYDYSEPIVVESAPETAAPAVAESDGASEVPPQALSQFDTARQEFYSGDFDAALGSVDAALKQMPSDAVLHEFRALTLFALKRYQESAATLYAVLSAGPGWNWTTMSGLYPGVASYTPQLRALEQYRKANPADPAARLLLAYHYLTAGHSDAAKEELQVLLRLIPTDPLAMNMLAELDPAAVPETAPPAVRPPSTTDPIRTEAVAGTWNAARQNGDTFALKLAPDGAFTWNYTSGENSQSVGGTYAIADDSVIALEMQDGGVMLAQLSSTGANTMDFMMLGDDRGSEALHFAKTP